MQYASRRAHTSSSMMPPIPRPWTSGATATGPRCQWGATGSRLAQAPVQRRTRSGVLSGLCRTTAGSTLSFSHHAGWQKPGRARAHTPTRTGFENAPRTTPREQRRWRTGRKKRLSARRRRSASAMPNARMFAGFWHMPRPRRSAASCISFRRNWRSSETDTVFIGDPEDETADLLVAQPVLRTADQRETQKAPHLQLPSAALDRDRTAILSAIVGIEHVAARPLIAVSLEIPENTQPNQWLVLRLALAARAAGIGIVRIGVDEFFNPSVKLAVHLPDHDQ